MSQAHPDDDLQDGDPDAPPPAPQRFVVTPEQAGVRADRLLAERSGLSRSRAKQLIEAGHLTVDGLVSRQPAAPAKPASAWCLQPPAPVAALPQAEDIPLAILFEDAELIVLDKPAGLVVHPAPGNFSGTLVNALLHHCGDQLPGIGGERRPGIVHRLDKDTSGVMVVAKTERALAALSADFASRDVERAYLALVWGLPNPASGEVEGAIGRDPRDRKRMAVVRGGGKPALTRYTLLDQHAGAVALLECRLATGRTHQIRVHLAARGHPVVGDPVYLRRIPAAARAVAPEARAALLDFPRQALHARTLGFTHPNTGARMHFAAEPPEDFATLLGVLGIYRTQQV